MRFLKHNSLSIVFLLFFIISFVGQIFTGHAEYNKELFEDNVAQVEMKEYLSSGHFLQSTFENWESEFLQMALFVLLTIFLRQKGSSESKGVDGKKEEVDREPSPLRKDAPWPIRKGGWVLAIYKHSLTISLVLLFLVSCYLHFYGSLKDENMQRTLKGEGALGTWGYLKDSRFWFESFQNWQSEFLSIFAIIFLSIYLRQKGSPQSKPIDAPHSETGE